MNLRAYLLLSAASAGWAGNFVLGRVVRTEMPPIGMVFWRWTLAFAAAAVILVPAMRRNWPVLRREWKLVGALGLLGMAAFPTLLYLSLHTTTAINATLLLAITPIVIPGISRVLLGRRQTGREILGAALSAIGVAVIVTRGDWSVVRSLAFTSGDVLMLIATAAWALYSVLLKRKPNDLDSYGLLGASMLVAVALLAPAYLWESTSVKAIPLSLSSFLVLGYLALIASLLAFYAYSRGILMVGPVRAGIFINLIPVFAILLAVVFLGERLYGFHAVGILVIASGLWLTTSPSATNRPAVTRVAAGGRDHRVNYGS